MSDAETILLLTAVLLNIEHKDIIEDIFLNVGVQIQCMDKKQTKNNTKCICLCLTEKSKSYSFGTALGYNPIKMSVTLYNKVNA